MIYVAFLAILGSAALPASQRRAGGAPPSLLINVPHAEYISRPVNPEVVVRQRAVALDEGLFAQTIPFRMDVHLFDDVHFTAAAQWLEDGHDGGLTWIGRIEGIADSRVTLVVHGRRASAIIWAYDSRYDLRPLENGLHVVQEIDSAQLGNGLREAAPDNPFLLLSGVPAAMALNFLMSPLEKQVFDLVNLERRKHSLHSLAEDDRLTIAARSHSQDMSQNDYLSHTSLDGRDPGERITAAGYSWNTYGENIARGSRTPEAVMNGWMNSDGHRNNILGASFCDLGVGYAGAGHYWTQKFARRTGVRQCPPAPEPPPSGGSSEDASSGGCFLQTGAKSILP